MATGKSWTASFFLGIWNTLNFTRKLFFNFIFILIIVGIVIALTSDDGKVSVPKGAALVLNPFGDIVIQEHAVEPFDKFLQEAFDQQEEQPEVLLQDIILAIDNAKQDNRIKALVLNLHGVQGGGLDKLKQIATSIESFKESGKPVYAVGDYYTQTQYYLASHADHLYLNPMGMMFLDGFGRYRMYYKDALEKLKANTHVFRVGTFKSAVEPVLRNDMSDEAREANEAWLNSLWSQYKQDVAIARQMPLDNFDEKVADFMAKFKAVDGDFAQYALSNNWVDELKTREQVREELIALLGSNKNQMSFNSIDFEDYLKVIKPPFPIEMPGSNKVGVVVAKGTILNGNQKPGTIGGDSTAKLLRKARMDDTVKAVVLYVDSPGGSAFASEVIRQEIEQLRKAGKPVVAAMSTYAASGGYWISASADEIWAAPSTITGSIGIFGMFMTYEDSLSYLGINTDGVGTTEFAGISPFRTLDPKVADVFQTSIEHGYKQFLNLVAESRDMDVNSVDNIAQGRVWTGEKAYELGLVDNLGYLEDAIHSAAQLAGLETFDSKYIERSLTPQELFWKEFFGNAAGMVVKTAAADSETRLMNMVKQLLSEYNEITRLNDPMGMYAYCFFCEY
ncbi:MAG: signal peptide peptidase SppA [Aestuariibacter sp.]